MPADWDYTEAAAFHDHRPAYADEVVDACLRRMDLGRCALVCDVGAGTGILTEQLLRRDLRVVAVEPNPAMRARGRRRTQSCDSAWVAGRAEELPLRSGAVRMVAFGSSFNVVDRERALRESARVLEPFGWFFCLWNHRQLDDPLQARIETLIRAQLPDYAYGNRREDQRPTLEASRLFRCIESLEAPLLHVLATDDWLAAWRSHLTLRRQAGTRFEQILMEIGRVVAEDGTAFVQVPYMTRAWIAELAC